jgi:hypothetical protein
VSRISFLKKVQNTSQILIWEPKIFNLEPLKFKKLGVGLKNLTLKKETKWLSGS